MKILDPQQPLDLLLPVWGGAYCRRAMDICIASLLAPENDIPNPITLIIRTTRSGRAQMQFDSLFKPLERRAKVYWMDMPETEVETPKMRAMSDGHLAGAKLAYDNKALAMFMCADTLHVAGSLPRLVAWAQQPGKRGVLSIAWGAESEASRKDMGHRPGSPWSVSHRLAAQCAIKSMHTTYQQSSVLHIGFGTDAFPVSPWWPVRCAGGALLTHSLTWSTSIINMARVPVHDTYCLENWTVDGDYAHRNGADPAMWHVVTDSDDHISLGLTAKRDMPPIPFNLWKRLTKRWPREPEFIAGAIQRARQHPTMDPLKRELFARPVLIHGAAIHPTVVADTEFLTKAVIAQSSIPLLPGADENLGMEGVEYPPQLVGSTPTLNYVAWARSIYSVPKRLGRLDIDNPHHRRRRGIKRFDTLGEARDAAL